VFRAGSVSVSGLGRQGLGFFAKLDVVLKILIALIVNNGISIYR